MNLRITHKHLSIECHRCLWFELKGVVPPEGPFPTVLSTLESLLQGIYREHRGSSLPGHLRDQLQGHLARIPHELTWHDTSTGLTIVGRLDEALVVDGKYRPLDRKVRGDAIQDRVHPVYKLQLDVYTFLLEKRGYPVDGKGILVVYTPRDLSENADGLTEHWAVQVIVINTDPGRVIGDLKRLRYILDSPAPPDPDQKCTFCKWEIARKSTGYVP